MSDYTKYSKNASSDVQGTISEITGALEKLIDDHEIDVNAVMSETVIEGADVTYLEKDQRWALAAHEAKEIIAIIRSVMQENDEIADTALTRARTAAEGI
ncbi:hypothetical protein [Nocardiopsis sp. MG754419]|uniref:hypothetical protein n=1 Tax=Nocardiopsis sp. MG754419 TaxID=2259865 RepID=UPI001BAA346A|nr:hypothetical protein [Nocardiopsis sp. MG754419]MBR8740983.1 hypothetical protein [Nocardiopsis sp. MG754419]